MIQLHGKLARQFKKKYGHDPRNIPIRVRSVRELMGMMEANFPGFRRLFNKSGYYHVAADNHAVGENEVDLRFLAARVWSIIPMAAGAKEGVGQVILGAVMIAVGAVSNYFAPGNPFGAALIKMGIATAIGGVGQMLTSTPNSADPGANEAADERRSFLFSGPTNVVEPGTVLPLGYGELYVGSITVSGGEIIEEY